MSAKVKQITEQGLANIIMEAISEFDLNRVVRTIQDKPLKKFNKELHNEFMELATKMLHLANKHDYQELGVPMYPLNALQSNLNEIFEKLKK